MSNSLSQPNKVNFTALSGYINQHADWISVDVALAENSFIDVLKHGEYKKQTTFDLGESEELRDMRVALHTITLPKPIFIPPQLMEDLKKDSGWTASHFTEYFTEAEFNEGGYVSYKLSYAVSAPSPAIILKNISPATPLTDPLLKY